MKKALQSNGVYWGILTGVLFATSYPPFPAWALFFSWVPLWFFWTQAKTLKQVLISGFAAQFTLTLIGFNWIAHTATEYGHIPAVLSFFVLLGFCCFASLNVVLAGAITWLLQRRLALPLPWFLALLSVLSAFAEWVYPTIFPWNPGYSLYYSGFKAAQLAEHFGFNGVSILVYLANANFTLAWIRFPKPNWARTLLYFILGLFVCEGLGQLSLIRLGQETDQVKTLVVQPNIGNYDKYYAERGDGYQQPIIAKDFEYTVQGLKKSPSKPDLVVWPETAFPANLDPYYQDSVYARQLKAFVDEHNVALVTGAYSEDPLSIRERKSYNAVFAIEPHGQPAPGYRKHLLLAFGEYFPGAEYIPFLKKIVPEISDFGRGEGASVIRIKDIPYAPLICYEGLDSQYVGQSVAQGGKILLNLTNDSWFGDFFEPRQHMIMTAARTIEYRRPLVRVTNTGLTSVFDSKGKKLLQGPQNVWWAETVNVPYFNDPPHTIYSYLSPYMFWFFLILATLVVYLGISARAKQRT